MKFNRLNWWLEYHCKFPPSQFRFRKNKSCIDNLSILYTNIIKAFKFGSSTAAVFLDVGSAFDNVLGDILIPLLCKLGISPSTVSLISNSLKERQVHCRYEEIDEIFTRHKELPQDNILSPILFAI